MQINIGYGDCQPPEEMHYLGSFEIEDMETGSIKESEHREYSGSECDEILETYRKSKDEIIIKFNGLEIDLDLRFHQQDWGSLDD
jgi:hypothetical protein